MAQLINRADVYGTYDGIDIDNFTTLSVELSALKVTKTANKDVWVKGPLTYTIIVENIDKRDPLDPEDPGLPVSNIRLTDIIDTKVVSFDTTSVEINGEEAHSPDDFTYIDGVLTILSLTSLNPGKFHTITFQVNLPQP